MAPQSYGYNESDTGQIPEPRNPGQPQTSRSQMPNVSAPNPSTNAQQAAAYPSQTFNMGTSAPVQSAPLEAEDADLIENEWVDVAKKIISDSRGDPFNQSKGMTMLRADYMKKRYNKDIKIPEN